MNCIAPIMRTSKWVMLALLMSATAAAGEFPDDWFWKGNDGKRPAEHLGFEGKPMPELDVLPWVNGELEDDDLQGKILVIDFWATWCGPCRAAFPKNNQIASDYADKNVLFVGVCTDNSEDEMISVIKKDGAKYPNAFIDGNQVMTDWPVQWFPTYAVVDETGTVRAIGLQPDKVTLVVDALIAESAASDGKARIPGYWLEGDAESRGRLDKLVKNAEDPPALVVENWINSEPLALEELEGKVVVLSFGAVWASGWLDTIEELNRLQETYGKEGLQIIGICATHEGYALPDIAEKYDITFPVAVDVENQTNRAYGPNNFPDLYVFDAEGNLRIADMKSDNLESAIKALLKEAAEKQVDQGEEAEDELPDTDLFE